MLWRHRSPTTLASGVLLAAGVVCFATEEGEHVGLESARGTVLWRAKGPGRVTSLGSAGDHLWAIHGEVDLRRERDPEGPLVALVRIGP